jgi:hypothetical protein
MNSNPKQSSSLVVKPKLRLIVGGESLRQWEVRFAEPTELTYMLYSAIAWAVHVLDNML